MSAAAIFCTLAPELILLIGACGVLIMGAFRANGARALVSPLAFLTVVVALGASVMLGEPKGTEAFLGLWFHSLTFYARIIGLSVGALIVLVNWRQAKEQERGEYLSMILFSLLGVLLTASANDVVLFFFAIELVSIPTYVLIALSRTDARASEAAVKYFFLGALSAAILAYGLSFLYGAMGTTTLYSVSGGAVTSNLSLVMAKGGIALVGLLLVFGGLAFKIAAVPFHVYAADVYEGAASPVTGLLGFVPKFAGFLALIKVFAACNWVMPPSVWWMVWIVAAATMTAGNTLGLLQRNAKRMLGYSSIAHTGYMLMALLVGPIGGDGPLRDGAAALLFYMAVYGVMNLGAFAVLGAYRVGDGDLERVDDLGGLSARSQLGALALAVCVFSLMGFPPTAGFLGKFYLVGSAVSVGDASGHQGALLVLVVIAVLNAAIGAAYYLRIVQAAYVGAEISPVKPVGGMPIRVGAVLCALAMVFLFAFPAALSERSKRATVVLQETIRRDTTRVTMSPTTPETSRQ